MIREARIQEPHANIPLLCSLLPLSLLSSDQLLIVLKIHLLSLTHCAGCDAIPFFPHLKRESWSSGSKSCVMLNKTQPKGDLGTKCKPVLSSFPQSPPKRLLAVLYPKESHKKLTIFKQKITNQAKIHSASHDSDICSDCSNSLNWDQADHTPDIPSSEYLLPIPLSSFLRLLQVSTA